MTCFNPLDGRSPRQRAAAARWRRHAAQPLTKAIESKAMAFGGLLELKTTATAGAMTFSGYCSTWAGPDSHGDAIDPGAYRDTIAAWKASGEKLPLIDQHRYDSVRAVVGYALELKEDSRGLFSKWRMIDTRDGEEAFARVEAKLITGLSIGFTAESRAPTKAERDRGIQRVLTRIALMEVSLVIWPANSEARITGKRPYIELETASYSQADALRTRLALLRFNHTRSEQRAAREANELERGKQITSSLLAQLRARETA